ncbi:unnamed protein product [Rhizophagus irregularis]|nr:unnamed protein product [Rhizophagus irregularis]
MAEWADTQIRTLIDERRTRNDEFHNLGRNRKIFWNSIADKINQENRTSLNGRSRLGVQYFDEFCIHFWERPEDEFDRVRSINTFNRRRSRESGNIMPVPSTREVECELRSSERRLSQSPSISRSPSVSRSQSPPISRRQSPSVGRRRSLSIR